MNRKQNVWQFFFDQHAPSYMDNPFTKNTHEEVDFIVDELNLPLGSHILDVGCGTGRHAIELARRGYQVTGVDLSTGMLSEAQRGADKAGVEIDLIHADAARFTSEILFDAAICICEGAFGLLGSDDDPYLHELRILKNIHDALKPDGMFILTALNGMRKMRAATEEAVTQGTFDPLTLVETYSQEIQSEDGNENILLRERGFVPTELILLLLIAGFRVEHIWGGTAGNWNRAAVDMDEMEIMTIARKGPTGISEEVLRGISAGAEEQR
jgi:cyclopropane fatty-acyl-phospholipid synthase-like methyltransferase